MALALAMESAFILGGSSSSTSSDGFEWANVADLDPLHAWDFLTNQAKFSGVTVGPLANTPGWSFTRASTGYAQTSAGVLTSFASGELRRTDKGVLIEGARTNLCLQSQTFDNASWSKTTATVSADAAVAPDGTTTADKLVEDTSNAQHRLNQVITVSNTTAYTFSVYAKALERLNINMRISTTSTVADASFNLQAGTALTPGAGTSTITALVGGWYRCSITGTTDSTSATVRINLGDTASNATQATYTGDGTSGLYLWGAQLEQASFPSSLVTTTTASATRAADVLTVPVSGIDYPISLFAEFERAVNTATQENQLYVYNTDSNERALVHRSSGGGLSCLVTAGGVTQASLSSATSPAVGVVARVAARIALNDVNVAGGGVLATAETSVTLPSSPTTIRFGSSDGGTFYSFGYLRRCALWTRALTGSELQTVST